MNEEMCCGDDSNEYLTYYVNESGVANTEYAACCISKNDCAAINIDSTVGCYSSGSTNSLNHEVCDNGQWYLDNGGSAGDSDYTCGPYDDVNDEQGCETAYGEQAWAMNTGDSESECWQDKCCGDSEGEYYTEYTREDGSTADYQSCCKGRNDCVSSSGICYSPGTGPGYYVCSDDGRWLKRCGDNAADNEKEYDFTDKRKCENKFGTNAWEMNTGNSSSDCWQEADMCCGDDADEYLRQYTRNDGSTANYWSCCKNETDCVSASGLCYKLGTGPGSYECVDDGRWNK
jgi:hypothetical protein